METRSETEAKGEGKGREGSRQQGGVAGPSPEGHGGGLNIEERQDEVTRMSRTR